MSNTVIKLEHLSKMYKLGVINNGTLFRDMQTWWALKCGKDDPHSKIGEDKYSGSDNEFWALKDLNLDIKQGDRVGIIGKNGAGKSTLLKVLSRITTPTEGCVKIKGKVSSLLEVGTGFHGELTGRENIYLNGAILGMKTREIDRKLDEIIDFSGIEKHIDTPVKRYSSGMYVRLAFAVAAHLDNDILIADEVLAVGDAEFQKKAIGKMSDLSTSQGRTVLFVSHNMASIKQLCNAGVLLEKGRVKLQSDSIDEVISGYLGNSDKCYSNAEKKLDGKILKYATAYSNNNGITIEARYSKTSIVDPYLGFVVYDESGSPVFGINPRNYKITKNTDLAEGFIKIEITEPKLMEGNYTISLWMGNFINDIDTFQHCLTVFVDTKLDFKHKTHFSVSGSVVPQLIYNYN